MAALAAGGLAQGSGALNLAPLTWQFGDGGMFVALVPPISSIDRRNE